MLATTDNIWQVPAYLPYLQPELTDEMTADAEKRIGYRLPAEYLDLLRKQNGGYIRFRLPQMVHDKISGIGPHFPALTDFDWSECQEYVTYQLEGLVPFDGDGHWHLCLDYRSDPSVPSITYADVETDWEKPVASSFAAYLSMLEIEMPFGENYVLESISDIEQIKKVLMKSLGASFGPTDTMAQGYPIETANLGSRRDPEWLWLSPNTVPRYFARVGERGYENLKDMPGVADRYPGLPANSYLISTTDDVRQRVQEAFHACGLKTRPLREYLRED